MVLLNEGFHTDLEALTVGRSCWEIFPETAAQAQEKWRLNGDVKTEI